MLRILGFVIAIMAPSSPRPSARTSGSASIVDMSVTSARPRRRARGGREGHGLISRTAVAEEAVPRPRARDGLRRPRPELAAARLMARAALRRASRPTSTTADQRRLPEMLKSSLGHSTWLSDTRMFFRTDLGDQIHIDNGIAWVKGVDGVERGEPRNSTCAAFKASGVDLVDLQNRADAALLDEHRRLGDTWAYSTRQIRRRACTRTATGRPARRGPGRRSRHEAAGRATIAVWRQRHSHGESRRRRAPSMSFGAAGEKPSRAPRAHESARLPRRSTALRRLRAGARTRASVGSARRAPAAGARTKTDAPAAQGRPALQRAARRRRAPQGLWRPDAGELAPCRRHRARRLSAEPRRRGAS